MRILRYSESTPIRPRETEPEEVEERNGKKLGFASNRMEMRMKIMIILFLKSGQHQTQG
jgi:hypothetical protein